MTKRGGVLFVLVVLIVIGATSYWYFSPYLAIYEISVASREHDSDAFNDHVDYPRLRESLKGEFSARMTAEMAKTQPGESDMARGFQALGVALAATFVDRMVDTLVQPASVMAMMRKAKLERPPAKSGADSDSSAAQCTGSPPQWITKRKTMNRLIAYAPDREDVPLDARLAIVFEREGFASWKLVGVHLPQSDEEKRAPDHDFTTEISPPAAATPAAAVPTGIVSGPFVDASVMTALFSNYNFTSHQTSVSNVHLSLPSSNGNEPFGDGLAFTSIDSTIEFTRQGSIRRAVVLKTVPAGDFECHACTPVFGYAIFKQVPGGWAVESFEPTLTQEGGYGKLPEHTSWLASGPNTEGFLVHAQGGGMGETYDSVELFHPTGPNSSTAVFAWQGQNFNEVGIRLGAASNQGDQDIEVATAKYAQPDGDGGSLTTQTLRFSFNGVKYMQVGASAPLVTGAPPQAVADSNPSFDCAKARSVSEKLICGDLELGDRDRRLAAAYLRAKPLAPDAREFSEETRQGWNHREKTCTDKSCLIAWYDDQDRRFAAILLATPQHEPQR